MKNIIKILILVSTVTIFLLRMINIEDGDVKILALSQK